MKKLRTSLLLEQLEQRTLLSSSGLIDVAEVRSIDGTGNNEDNPDWGSTDIQLVRLTTVDYADGISDPAGADRPSAREVSNVVIEQTESILNDRYLSDLLWQWGQFIDHDIDLTVGADPAESFPIEVPTGDPYFDPTGSGTATIDLSRSAYDPATGITDPRQQINAITAFIDGSNVYGSDEERAAALRTFVGGKLKTSDGDLLPFNVDGLDNAGGPSDSLFLAGDVRANEQAGLTAMHTLFVREHNRIAEETAAQHPDWTDEQIYQHARALVIAEIQAITYNEFLPALLGEGVISPYQGYDSTVDPSISNLFSTAAYRFGHSMLSSELLRLDNNGNEIAAGNLALRDAFFSPTQIIDNGIDSLLKGLATQQAQEIDSQVVDDVRNFLFGPPGSGGFDLAALNIQRGRDHGLPSYNQARIDYGLDPVTSFADITSDVELQAKLQQVYGSVDNIDVWVGGLAEDHVPGGSMGELFTKVIVDQFEKLRDGDRFWYQNTFSGRELDRIEHTTLADIIRRNTVITNLQENVFFVESVIYHGNGSGPGDDNTTIVVDSNSVDLISGQRLLDSRALADATQVVLAGADFSPDHITVDLSRAASTLAGHIVVSGGFGGGDVLTILATPGADTIQVTANEITVNGQTIDYSGFERIEIRADRSDDIQVDDGVDNVLIDLQGPGGPRRGPGGPGAPNNMPPPNVDGNFLADPRRRGR